MIVVAVLVGCVGVEKAPGATHDSAPSADAVTYYRDMRPIFDRSCVGCHQDGGIAPFSLTDATSAQAYAAAIGAAVADRSMPPWKAAQGCADYAYDPSLSDDEIALVQAWVDGGAADGDPGDAPGDDVAPAGLSRVDVTTSMAEPYTPVLSPDEYRCFLVDWPEDANAYVTGFSVHPGQPDEVHHVIAFLATSDQIDDYEALDAEDAAPGWSCFGGPGASGQPVMLGGWAPGGVGGDFPEATGLQVLSNSQVVLQIHYNTAYATPSPDQTSIDFKVDQTVTHPAKIQPWTDPSWVGSDLMKIPAGAVDQSYSFAYAMPMDVFAYSANLHMHQLGTHASLEVDRTDGSQQCLLDIPSWDFHWQRSYGFAAPVRLNAGDSLRIECHWDNPTDQDVTWGEGTADEMCIGFLYMTYAY